MWKYALVILFAMTAYCEDPKWSISGYIGDGLGGKENLVSSFAVGYQVTTKTRVKIEFNNDVLFDEDDPVNSRTRVKSTDISFVRPLLDQDTRMQPFVGAGLGYGRFNVLPRNYWLDRIRGLNPTYEKKRAVHVSALAGIETAVLDRWLMGVTLRHALADDRHTTSVGVSFRVKI